MSILTQAVYDRLAGDSALVAMLATYKGAPAIFTMHPVPGDARLPYVVSVGEISQVPFDTKTCRGRELIRDVRVYADADGNPILVEAIAERVRALLHRGALTITGFQWVLSNVVGPIVADESHTYGRVVSMSVKAQEE